MRLQIYSSPILSGPYANICETHVCNIMYILPNCRPGMSYCVIPICKQIAELNNQIEYVPLPVSLTLKKVEIVHMIWFFFAFFLVIFFVLISKKCFALLILALDILQFLYDILDNVFDNVFWRFMGQCLGPFLTQFVGPFLRRFYRRLFGEVFWTILFHFCLNLARFRIRVSSINKYFIYYEFLLIWQWYWYCNMFELKSTKFLQWNK